MGNLLRFVCSHAYLLALMTQKSCAVGMRNAILRNHLKLQGTFFRFSDNATELEDGENKFVAIGLFLH